MLRPFSFSNARRPARALTWLVMLAILCATAVARAHPPVPTTALVRVTDDRQVVVILTHDALAFALNDTSDNVGDSAMHELLDAPESRLSAALADGRERFATEFKLAADGSRLATRITEVPTLEAVRAWKADHPNRRLPCKLDFVATATLPAGAAAMTIQFPEILSNVVITVDRPRVEPVSMPLGPAEVSPAIDITMVGQAPDGAGPNHKADHAAVTDQIGFFGVAWRFIRLGFTHIVPHGPDHSLFVLGLFLLAPRFKPVIWQISAFTVAHTITLTLTSLHIVGLPGSIVEPTIAASIAFIGVENLLTTKVHPWRPVVAFLFGLVHGMGVATAFNDAGFPPGQLVTSLALFTIGVEAGHVAVLAAAFLVLGWFRDKKWYRKGIAIPLSLLISAVALYWMVHRIVQPG